MSLFDNDGSYIELLKKHNCGPIKGIVHVGAWDMYENKWYLPMVGENVVWVEANPHTYSTMSKPAADKVNQKCYSFAACNIDDQNVHLYIPYAPTRGDCSSLAKKTALGEGTPIVVKTKTLDTLFKEENLDINNYDFLNVDTEGAELLTLQGFEGNLDKIKYLVVEITKKDRFNTGCSFETLDKYLTEKGFVLKEMSILYDDDWGDAFYIRPGGDSK